MAYYTCISFNEEHLKPNEDRKKGAMKKFIRMTVCACAILSVWMMGEGSARENRFSKEVEQLLQQKMLLLLDLSKKMESAGAKD